MYAGWCWCWFCCFLTEIEWNFTENFKGAQKVLQRQENYIAFIVHFHEACFYQLIYHIWNWYTNCILKDIKEYKYPFVQLSWKWIFVWFSLHPLSYAEIIIHFCLSYLLLWCLSEANCDSRRWRREGARVLIVIRY